MLFNTYTYSLHRILIVTSAPSSINSAEFEITRFVSDNLFWILKEHRREEAEPQISTLWSTASWQLWMDTGPTSQQLWLQELMWLAYRPAQQKPDTSRGSLTSHAEAGSMGIQSPKEAVMEWHSEGASFHFTPVPVSKRPIQTVGLGEVRPHY